MKELTLNEIHQVAGARFRINHMNPVSGLMLGAYIGLEVGMDVCAAPFMMISGLSANPDTQRVIETVGIVASAPCGVVAGLIGAPIGAVIGTGYYIAQKMR